MLAALPGGLLHAQTDGAAALDPVVVTATRAAERAFDLPVAIDAVDRGEIQNGQLGVNLSESLARVPGVSIQSRGNYAQDLQLSIRGFGARANFGVRGVRLYQDHIPATMPDGQGQTGSFSLISAQRIEVLRGPFSSLYGNASGGVISVFTENGPSPPQLTLGGVAGSYGTWNALAKLEGERGAVNYVVAGNAFGTGGYREHSRARRDLANAKLTLAASPATTITVVGTALRQPDAQDPLGLTRAQWEADPRQADPAAVRFDTRKTVNQTQGGVTVEQRFSADADLRVTGYGGTRAVRQYLAFPGTAPTSSGGVTDLDRSFGGVDGRVTARFLLAGRPATLTLGADYETQRERRRGFVNDDGALGELRRDEDDFITNTDGYLQLAWAPSDALSLLAGARYSDVRFRIDDHYTTEANPDDGGNRSYHHTSPVLGAVWHVADGLNLYGNYGQGFETPTFAELAYRPGASGLNLALQPAVSRSGEIGLKARIGNRHRINLAWFDVATSDEIVVDTASGGRTTYRNAGDTRRRGAEVSWEGELGGGFSGYAAYTWLSAKFVSPESAGAVAPPPPDGARLPGVPAATAYAELAWSRPAAAGFNAAIEVQYAGRMYVDDRNTDAAPAWIIGNVRVGFEQRSGRWVLREFLRVNNVADVNYVGSVIVGDASGRYFEPAARRNYLVGASVAASF